MQGIVALFFSFKIGMLAAVMLNAIGAAMRFFGGSNYMLTAIGQGLCALAQCGILPIPTRKIFAGKMNNILFVFAWDSFGYALVPR